MDDMESGIRLARRLPFQKGMENKRCLVIADDLTGAADTGVQFVIRRLNTCLISPVMRSIDFMRGCPRKGARRGNRICGDRLFCGFGKEECRGC